jgi:hypothetical protein
MESGIDPALFNWYVSNYDKPVIDYPSVTAPGHILRDEKTGAFTLRKLTVSEYFQTLGVEPMFSVSDPESISAMQYAAINPLGFVGYQVGEEILVKTGFYSPARVQWAGHEYDSYYIRPASTNLVDRVSRLRMELSDDGTQIVATDVNEWRGTFRGRYGIYSLDDLRTARQEYVIRDLMDFNYARITSLLEAQGTSLVQELMVPRTIQCTVSGALASAHLCGADAVASFLRSGSEARDEFGTPLSSYMVQFEGHDTPYV